MTAGPATKRGTQLNRMELLKLLEEQLRVLGDQIPAVVPEDCDLREDLGLDSLDLLEFIANAEYALKLQFPNEVLPEFTSLGVIADHVIALLDS